MNTTPKNTDVKISVRKNGTIVYDQVHTIEGNNKVEAVTETIIADSLREPADYRVSAKDITRENFADVPSVSQLYDVIGDGICFEILLVIDENRLNAAHSGHETCDV